MRARGLAPVLAALAAGPALVASSPASWGCAIPTLEVVTGVVRGVSQEAAADATPSGPDIPGAILELRGPAGPLRFRLSRNIGMALQELGARAADRRPVRVKYETLYDGHLRALEIVGAERGR